MPISRIARTHLLYQFVILTLLFLGIGYYELLLQNKYILFLALMPMFFYQLVILSCCTELLPIPRWMNPSDIKDTTDSVSENPSESSQPTQNPDPPNNMRSTLSPGAENEITRPRKYKLRNWKKNNSDEKNIECTSPSVSLATSGISSAEKFEFPTETDEDGFQRSELTKRYFFPYRQKRLEQWITSKDNARPYKIRNRDSTIQEHCDMDHAINELENPSCKNSVEISESEYVANKESKFIKSYSFPYRQKRMEHYVEPVILEEQVETPSMPNWKSVEYSASAKSESRIRSRRAVSSVNLTSAQLETMNDKEREFSQSVEISNPFDQLYSDSKKSTPKVSAVGFNKIKLGIVNCFFKMKKDGSKTISEKKDTGNKLRSFKNLFQSRENLFSPRRDECNSLKSKDKRKESCSLYTGSISFDKYNFDNNVANRILELSKI